MREQRTHRTVRTTAGLAVTGLAAGLVLAGPTAQAATPQARSSAAWMTTQLDEGLVRSEYHDGTTWVGYTDHGLSLDVFYAFADLRVRAPKRRAILRALEPEVAAYTGAGATQYAGAIGKLLTAVQVQGIDPATYGDGDLLARLEERVVDSGPEEGRGKDAFDPTSPWGADYSNSFGQSYVVTALVEADSAEADEAIGFLLRQQCTAGFFRESMDSADFTCDGGTPEQSRPDVDATATAVLALRRVLPALSAPLRGEVRVAARKGTRWLAARQVRSGTFTGARNSNSTGLAAAALAAAGRDVAARKAARWVNKLRVTRKLARRTALRPRDIGAVAFDVAAMRAAKKEGITRATRYEWRRATAQAAPALDALRR